MSINKILFVVLNVSVCYCHAQKTLFFEKKLEAEIGKYYASNVDDFIKMTYPKVFKVVNNLDSLKSFNLVKKTGFTKVDETINLTKVSDIIYEGDEKFCRIFFKRVWKVEGITDLTLDQAWELISKYGMDHVIPDQKEKWFEIIINQSILAISNKDTENYKYLEINNENKKILTPLIPHKVLDKLGYPVNED